MGTDNKTTGYPASPYYGGGAVLSRDDSAVRYYLQMLRRRLWTIVPVTVIVCTIGLLWAFRTPVYYRATAKVLVERQIPRVLTPDAVSPDTPFWDAEFYQTQAELVRTRDVLSIALKNPDLQRLFPSNAVPAAGRSFAQGIRRTILSMLGVTPSSVPEPWETLRGQIFVEQQKDTYFILVSSQGGEPRRIALIANSAAQAFTEYHVLRRKEFLGDAFLFLEEEKQKEEKMLLDAQKELQAFRERTREVNLDGAEKQHPVIQRLSELSDKLTQTQMERLEVVSALGVIRQMLQAQPGQGMPASDKLFTLSVIRSDPTVEAAQRELSQARANAAKLADTYGPDHPLMREARSAETRLDTQFRDVLNQKVTALDSTVKVLDNKEASLKQEIEERKEEALKVAKETFAFSQLQNTVKRHQKLYDALVERLREVDLSTGFVRTNAKVVETAGVPSVPAGPNRMKMVLMSILLGIALGVGVGFVMENIDDTVKTPEDLKERLALPLLGFVPRIEPEQGLQDEKWFVKRGRIAIEEPTSSAAEAYRNIRTRLLFAVPAGERKVIGLTSCSPGEGKTTTSTNLSVVMAAVGKRVLLIDADIHRPVVHQLFEYDEGPGLTDILARGVDFKTVMHSFPFPESTVAGRLDIVTAGPESPNPAELLGSSRMREFLNSVRKDYDWIFVDIPPLLFISDASIVSATCEGVILVVRANRNNRSSLLRAKEQLADLKAHVVGCVLNDVQLSRYGRYSSDYSYYGYSKYSRKYHKSYYSHARPSSGSQEEKT